MTIPPFKLSGSRLKGANRIGALSDYLGQISLDGEPATLVIHDGRGYYSLEKKWSKFSLYKKDNTTVLVTTFDRVDGWNIKRDVELIFVTETETD